MRCIKITCINIVTKLTKNRSNKKKKRQFSIHLLAMFCQGDAWRLRDWHWKPTSWRKEWHNQNQLVFFCKNLNRCIKKIYNYFSTLRYFNHLIIEYHWKTVACDLSNLLKTRLLDAFGTLLVAFFGCIDPKHIWQGSWFLPTRHTLLLGHLWRIITSCYANCQWFTVTDHSWYSSAWHPQFQESRPLHGFKSNSFDAQQVQVHERPLTFLRSWRLLWTRHPYFLHMSYITYYISITHVLLQLTICKIHIVITIFHITLYHIMYRWLCCFQGCPET